LIVLFVSKFYVIGREALTEDYETTLRSSTAATWSPTPYQKSTVGRLSSGVGEGWLVVTRESGTRGTKRSTVYVVQAVEKVLKGWLGEVSLYRHVTLGETTARNVDYLVYLKLLVLLVNADGCTVSGTT
jgi:hypothetical protein